MENTRIWACFLCNFSTIFSCEAPCNACCTTYVLCSVAENAVIVCYIPCQQWKLNSSHPAVYLHIFFFIIKTIIGFVWLKWLSPCCLCLSFRASDQPVKTAPEDSQLLDIVSEPPLPLFTPLAPLWLVLCLTLSWPIFPLHPSIHPFN